MVPMNDIYEALTQVSDVTEAAAASIRGIVQGALDLETHLSRLGTLVGDLPLWGPFPESICYTLKRVSCK